MNQIVEETVKSPGKSQIVSGFAYALLATVFWSIVPVGIKYLLRQAMDPYSIAFSRFVLASFFLWLLASSTRSSESSRPTRAHYPLFVLGGLGMAGNYILYSLGLKYTTAAATNIIVQDEVVAMVILSYFVLGERIGRAKIAGMLSAIAGILVVFWNGQSMAALLNSKHLIGNVIVAFAGLSWPMYGIAQKLLIRKGVASADVLVRIFAVSAAISFAPAFFGFRLHGELTIALFAWLAVVGVIGTAAAYFCLARAFKRLPASTVAVTICMLPIFTLVTAGIFLDEVLTPSIALGAFFVVVGIIMIGREEASGV